MKFKTLVFPFLCGIVFSIAAICGTIYLVLASGIINPGADESIPALERWAAKTSIRAFLKKNTPDLKNPFPANAENLDSGCRLYVNNCAVCHGLADGKKSKISQGFYKDAPQFAKEDWSKDADGLIYWFIEHGVRLTAMPAYKNSLTEDEKWKIVMFIKEMRKLPKPVEERWQSFKSMDIAE